MPDLPDRARRRLEMVAAELPMSAQTYFFRRQVINWGVVTVMSLLLIASIVVSISIASGKGELRDEINELEMKWMYEQGRADEAAAQEAVLRELLAKSSEQLDRFAVLIGKLSAEADILMAVRQYVAAGGGDAELHRILGSDEGDETRE